MGLARLARDRQNGGRAFGFIRRAIASTARRRCGCGPRTSPGSQTKKARKGAFEAGQFADLIVPDRDYFSCAEDEIADTTSDLTIVGGKVVYGAGDFASLDTARAAAGDAGLVAGAHLRRLRRLG